MRQLHWAILFHEPVIQLLCIYWLLGAKFKAFFFLIFGRSRVIQKRVGVVVLQ